jgi:hypothetical protein
MKKEPRKALVYSNGGSPSPEFITLIDELIRWRGLLDSRFGQYQIRKRGARLARNSL